MYWRVQNWRDYVDTYVRGWVVNISVVDACPLRCPACWVGNGGAARMSGERMARETWDAIIKKLADMGVL